MRSWRDTVIGPWLAAPLAVTALVLFADETTELAANKSDPDFRSTVAPVLIRNCLECHRGDDPAGGLDLSTPQSLAAGGDSGVAIDTERAEQSLIWQKVSKGEMPPETALSEQARNVILGWVESGARWDDAPIDLFELTTNKRAGYDWWSLQPIADPDVPNVGAAHPIDAFVIARLQQRGLTMSPRADARTLVRRLALRLHGIHADPETVARLEADDSPQTYRLLVSEFLDSHRYGERWARHWLDVARFGESQGFERDRFRSHAWRYRDWVINALNDDLPYDQFVRMQLAGDCLPKTGQQGIIATGFLVAGAWDEVGQNQRSEAMKAIVRQDELEDYVGTVGQAFLGLTVNCARCHDHKFDPISQSEYYSLCSALDGVRHGDRDISPPDVRRKIDAQEAELKARIDSLAGEIEALEETLPEQSDVLKQAIEQLQKVNTSLPRELAYAVEPRQPADPMRFLARGNTKTPGQVVAASGLAAIQSVDRDFGLPADAPEAERRLRLADWISSHNNPLFARVIVNRLWQHHFGVGLVATPSDFGFTGGHPSHPQLLDFLASRLIESGWRLKSIHRLILTSATWQQASRLNEAAEAVDRENRLLWRGNRMRLDAESLRDSILLVSGQLNDAVGGPSFRDFETFNFNSQFYNMIDPIGPAYNRRTVYRMIIRSGRNRMLDAFDCPDPSATAPKRAVTTTPLQALSLLNHSFVLRMADHFAARVVSETGEDLHRQIERAAQIAWCRQPSEDERVAMFAFAQEHDLPALCRVLINSNEFLYVD